MGSVREIRDRNVRPKTTSWYLRAYFFCFSVCPHLRVAGFAKNYLKITNKNNLKHVMWNLTVNQATAILDILTDGWYDERRLLTNTNL